MEVSEPPKGEDKPELILKCLICSCPAATLETQVVLVFFLKQMFTPSLIDDLDNFEKDLTFCESCLEDVKRAEVVQKMLLKLEQEIKELREKIEGKVEETLDLREEGLIAELRRRICSKGVAEIEVKIKEEPADCDLDDFALYPFAEGDVADENGDNVEIKKNYRKIKLRKKRFVCKVCGMKFARKDYFMVHKGTHEQEDLPGSIDPDPDAEYSDYHQEFNSSDSDFTPIQKKSQRHKVKVKKIIKNTKKSLKTLKSTETPVDQRTCPICNGVFITYSKMIHHLNTKHERSAKFECTICHKGFLRKDYLRAHIVVHSDNPEKAPYSELVDPTDAAALALEVKNKKMEERTCPVCEKQFDKPSVMKLHLSCVHNDICEFTCEICSKKFKRKDSLKKHLESHKDSNVKPFQCDECEKAFKRKRDLEVHFRRHSGAKDMLCSLCGMSFRHEWSFKRHNILVHHHKPSKMYSCDSCGKVFKIKWHLDQHLMSKSHGGRGLGKRIRKKKNGLQNESEEPKINEPIEAIIDPPKLLEIPVIAPKLVTNQNNLVGQNLPQRMQVERGNEYHEFVWQYQQNGFLYQ